MRVAFPLLILFPQTGPIVDKQVRIRGGLTRVLLLTLQHFLVLKARYKFYHPSAEAVASMLTDVPYKILNAICFNLIIYFMTSASLSPTAPGPLTHTRVARRPPSRAGRLLLLPAHFVHAHPHHVDVLPLGGGFVEVPVAGPRPWCDPFRAP